MGRNKSTTATLDQTKSGENLSTMQRLRRRVKLSIHSNGHFRKDASSSDDTGDSRNENQQSTQSNNNQSGATATANMPPPLSDAMACHVCNVSLGIRRFKHNCRNCGRSVCSVHSKHHVPLPRFGILKEVRVCDTCTKQVLQRRAGIRSPRGGKIGANDANQFQDDEPQSRKKSAFRKSRSRKKSLADTQDNAICGILYNCLLEEQDNTMNDILYLGTLKKGSRSLASRNLNANVGIWKDRMFMLTPAEMLCFKPQEDSMVGEVRTNVHMTDILHIEVHENHPRVLTVVRSDGRLLRLRARTPEQCLEIYNALTKAVQTFQEALQRLQQTSTLDGNEISCITLQHHDELPEQIIMTKPDEIDTPLNLSMHTNSILRYYVYTNKGSAIVTVDSKVLEQHIANMSGAFNRHTPCIVKCPIVYDGMVEYMVSLHLDCIAMDQTKVVFKDHVTNIAILCFAISFYCYGNESYKICLWVWSIVIGLLCTKFSSLLHLLFKERGLKSLLSKEYQVKCVEINIDASSGTDEQGKDLIADDEVDIRFIEGCQGNMEEAKRRYVLMLKWRKEYDIDSILLRPHPQFQAIKESLIHYMHKRDKLGRVVTYEMSGTMKKTIQTLAQRGVSDESSFHHIAFIQDYYWRVVDPRPYPEGMQLKVIDLRGISMSDLSGDVVAFMKKCGQIAGNFNPERIYKIFIINPPSWFNMIWKIVSPLVNAKTRAKTHVVRGQKEITKALMEYIDIENIPAEYGGTCSCEGGCVTHSPEEVELRAYVEKLNMGENCEDLLRQMMERPQPLVTQRNSNVKSSSGTGNESDEA